MNTYSNKGSERKCAIINKNTKTAKNSILLSKHDRNFLATADTGVIAMERKFRNTNLEGKICGGRHT
jgi:hypothetical protein